MLDLMFQQRERKLGLRVAQAREVDRRQQPARRLQCGKDRRFVLRRAEGTGEPAPGAGFYRPGIARARADDAPDLAGDPVGRQLREVAKQVVLVEVQYEVMRQFE